MNVTGEPKPMDLPVFCFYEKGLCLFGKDVVQFQYDE